MAIGGIRTSATYGRGEVSIDLEGLDFLDHAEVLSRLEAVFESPAYRPPRLPDAAMKLLELSRKSNVDLRQILRILETDQLLAAEVLRISQSAAYAGNSQSPVRTLEDALLRLGLMRVSEVFLHASLNLRVFRVKAYQRHMDVLKQHSQAVAHLARYLSRKTALFDEHSFLCGLLHDVGFAAALIAIAEGSGRVEPPKFEILWPALRDAHARAGGTLARLWQLPPEVGFVVQHHHDFEIRGHVHPTAAVVAVADAAATVAGIGPAESDLGRIDKALGALGLAKADLDDAAREAHQFHAGHG